MSLFLFPILSFCKFEFYFNNNNLYIRLSFHFTYDNDEETIDFEIYLSIISNNVILMSLYPRIFKWFFDIYIYIYIYIYIIYIYIYLYIYTQHVYIYIYTHAYIHIHNFCKPSWSLDVSAILYRWLFRHLSYNNRKIFQSIFEKFFFYLT